MKHLKTFETNMNEELIKKDQVIELESAYGESVIDLLGNTTSFYPERVNDWVKINYPDVWEDFLDSGEEDIHTYVSCEVENLADEVTTRMINSDDETIRQFNITWNKYKNGEEI